jgi:acetyl esterase/lipase
MKPTSVGLGISRRDWIWMACSTGAAALAQPRPDDPMEFINPEFRPALQQVMKMLGRRTPLDASRLENARKSNFAMPTLASPAVSERLIPGPVGAPEVKVLIAGDSAGAAKPAVLNLHGGGFVLGTAASEKRTMQEISTTHDSVVVSVDYRLAPETRFPGSLEDNYAALRWMHTNARELGIDPKRIALRGSSAGGGHAATLAIAARDRAEFPICFLLMVAPMLDDRTGSSRKAPPSLGHFIWTAEDNRFGWTSLLGVPAGSPHVPPNSVPARVTNLAGLPPTFIGVGSADLFAPEDVDFARRLLEAGVATELAVVPGGFHGFDMIGAGTNLGRQFNQTWNEALRRAFSSSK